MLDVRKIRLILELRESGISNAEVLSAIEKIPREKFISEAYRNQAYENIALPIENNQTISQPYVVARMTELLDVKSNHKVLEIGTGSGYQCAVLSILARRVYTIERIKNLHEGSNNIFEKGASTNFSGLLRLYMYLISWVWDWDNELVFKEIRDGMYSSEATFELLCLFI